MVLLLFCILLPAAAGVLLPVLSVKERKTRNMIVIAVLAAEALLVTLLCLQDASGTLFAMTDVLRVDVKVDAVSRLFLLVSAFGYLLAGIFAAKYMDHEEKAGSFSENTFYCFYLTSLAALIGMAVSANLIAMYFFFEMATLLSMPLVLFERTKAAVGAALKYLFYSIAGAFLGLACIFVLSGYCTTLNFAAGGTLDAAAVSGHEGLILTMTFLGVLGFGAKAGLYPLHGWLPTAHPEAPAPASAVLSGVITKAGVLAILRLLYFTVGTDFLFGTWVQKALLALALLTVFMGSMMAFREKNLKKRLAYSTVSQISYILLGLSMLSAEGLAGGLLHLMSHAASKGCLFLVAGIFIYKLGIRQADGLKGVGRQMPVTLWCFFIAALSLVGIPPMGGFLSKWVIAGAVLSGGRGILQILPAVVLLISALLTAGYLFPVVVDGFFPGRDFPEKAEKQEPSPLMTVPLMVLCAAALAVGVFGTQILAFFGI